MYRNRNPGAIERARSLRKKMSVSEQWMWSKLRNDQLGFRFRRQFAVGPYCLDFYCPEARLCVEVDGELHVGRSSKDAERDAFLTEQGIMVLRIPSQDLFDDSDPLLMQKWLDSIVQHCVERTGLHESKRLKKKDWD